MVNHSAYSFITIGGKDSLILYVNIKYANKTTLMSKNIYLTPTFAANSKKNESIFYCELLGTKFESFTRRFSYSKRIHVGLKIKEFDSLNL